MPSTWASKHGVVTDKTANVHWEGRGKERLGKISTRRASPWRFQKIAQEAKDNCPLSTAKALASVPEITLNATLAH